METKALQSIPVPVQPTAPNRQVQYAEEEASSRKRQQPRGHDAALTLPDDQVTLSNSVAATLQRSEPVSSKEKTALLSSQKVTQFSVRV